jgi:hypothetical protein
MSNTIIRARRRHRFVILDQRAVEDSRLSWVARGLLAYLLSRPDDWRVPINDLRKRGDLGRDGIYLSFVNIHPPLQADKQERLSSTRLGT